MGLVVTVVIGIRCKNGLVVASDSQVEYFRGVQVKKLNANKIYGFNVANGSFFIGGAGKVADIEKLVAYVYRLLEETSRGGALTLEDIYVTLEKAVTYLHKEYNIERLRYLGYNVSPDDAPFFNPLAIIAGVLTIDNEHEFLMNLIHPTGLVEPITDYATIGSGAAYAELLLKNLYNNDLAVMNAIPIAIYVIEEVKSIDPSVGGDTQVAFIREIESGKEKKVDIRILERDEVEDIAKKLRTVTKSIWSEFLNVIGGVLSGGEGQVSGEK